MLGNNEKTRGDIEAQARETLAAIGRTLRAAGTDWNRVTHATIYVTDVNQTPAVDRAWREVFGDAPPARTSVRTGLVAPDGLVEIMANAVR
jgi:enamine deaminase RidA (YjgF/YER057c/UK114 family)